MAKQQLDKTDRSGTPLGMRDTLKKATTEMLVLFMLRQKPMYTYEMTRSIEQATDGKLQAQLRRLHYRYDPEVTAGDFDDDRRAEDWITDANAFTKNGTKLARISGKFRTKTIDRKDEIFAAIGKTLGVN